MKETVRRMMQLCSDQSCCPTVKFVTRGDENLVILEDDCNGKVELKEKEWKILKDLILKGEL
jgi:hypothetical protein